MSTLKTTKGRLFGILNTTTNVTDKATRVYGAVERRIRISKIESLKNTIMNKREDISTLEDMSLVADVNAGIQALDQGEVQSRIERIMDIELEIVLLERELAVNKKTFKGLFA